MRIISIRLKGFGRFRDLSLEDLGGRFNLIYGPNEAGKTTLQMGVLSLLYGMKRPEMKRVIYEDVNERMTPWSGGPYEAVLIFESEEGGRFEIQRSFDKETGYAKIWDVATGREITADFHEDRTRERDFAFQHLNLTKGQFRDICMIDQMPKGFNNKKNEWTEWKDHAAIAEKLKGVVDPATGEVSAEATISKIDELLGEIGSERAPTKPLRQCLDRRDRLVREKKSIEARRLELAEAEKRIREGEGTLAELEGRRCRLEFLQKAHELSAVEKRLNDLAELDVEEGVIRQELVELTRYEKFPVERNDDLLTRVHLAKVRGQEKESLTDDLNEKVVRWKEGEGKLREMGAVLGREMGPGEMLQLLESLYQGTRDEEVIELKEREIERRMANLQGLRVKWKVLSLAAVVSALAGAATLIFAPHGVWKLLAASALTASFIASALMVRRVRRRLALDEERLGREREELAAQRREAEERAILLAGVIRAAGVKDYRELRDLLGGKVEERRVIADLKDALNRIESSIGQAKRDVADILAVAGVRDVEEFKEGCRLHERYLELSAELKRIEEKRGLLLEGRARWDLEKSRDGLREIISSLRAAVGDDVAQLEETLSMSDLERELESLEMEIGELRAEVSRCRGIKEAGLQGYRSLAQVEEEMEECRERLEYLRFHRAALERAREVIQRVSSEYHIRFAPQLAAICGRVLNSITSRYDVVGVEEDLTLNVRVPEVNQFKPAAELSKGTLDQAYLALKLSVVKVLTGDGERPPLLLDDPLASYDRERLIQTLSFLVDFSSDFQIIYLTCHPHHMDILREVVSERGLPHRETEVEDLVVISVD